MAFATASEIRQIYPGIVGTDAQLTHFLEYASEILSDRSPHTATASPLKLRGIVCDMVNRHLADPVRQEQLADASFTYDTAWMRQGIRPTADELADLVPVGKRKPRFGTIRPTIGMAP